MRNSQGKSSLWDGYGLPGPLPEEEATDVDWDDLHTETLPRGFPLVKLCLGNVLRDMEIVAFQAISLFTALAFLGIYLYEILPTEDWDTTAKILANPLILIALYPYLIVSVTITTYFSMASVGVATMRLRGKNPTFRDGIRYANSRLLSIIGWALVAASVGLLFALMKRSKNPGTKLLASIGELGWAVACCSKALDLLMRSTEAHRSSDAPGRTLW
jgi:hypothetical protein